MRFINPKTDFAFKKIFASVQSKSILISFLNAILYEAQPIIQDIDILDPYQAPRLKGMKDSFLDVKARITGNRTVIIEMQVLNVLGFEKRVLYNAAKAFSIQLDAWEDYARLNPVIALTITDFEMFPHSPKVISRFGLKEKEALTDYTDDIELAFVELPKFNKPLEALTTITDKWIYFIKQAESLEVIPESFSGVPAMEQAFNIAEVSNLSREELEIFERKQMFLHDNRNAFLKATQQGLQQGLQQGRRLQAEAIARSLLDVLDLETISQTTRLTLAEIEQLRPQP